VWGEGEDAVLNGIRGQRGIVPGIARDVLGGLLRESKTYSTIFIESNRVSIGKGERSGFRSALHAAHRCGSYSLNSSFRIERSTPWTLPRDIRISQLTSSHELVVS